MPKSEFQPEIDNGIIMGASEMNGELHFLFKWDDEEYPSIMSLSQAKLEHPLKVIKFFESRMVWETNQDEQEININFN